MGNHQEIKYDYTMKIKEERLNPIDFQGANVLWFDAKVNIGENLNYQNIKI